MTILPLHSRRSFLCATAAGVAASALPSALAQATDYIVSGGGAKNETLMRMLSEGLQPLGVTVSTTEKHGVPPQAKEAMAFALLAWLRWNGRPGNVPSATGASRPAMLGRITLP